MVVLLLLVTRNFAMQMARWRQQRPLTCFASQSKGNVTDLYRLLGVSASSSKAEIRAAYISKIKVMHPDVSADDDATEDAVALNAAYTALMVGLHFSSLTTSPIRCHKNSGLRFRPKITLFYEPLSACRTYTVDALQNTASHWHCAAQCVCPCCLGTA